MNNSVYHLITAYYEKELVQLLTNYGPISWNKKCYPYVSKYIFKKQILKVITPVYTST
jgi:hypothetical protein